MQRVLEACSSARELGAEDLRALRAGIECWRAQGGTFDACMGWSVPQGGRYKTPRAVAIRVATSRALAELVKPLAGAKPHQQVLKVMQVIRDEAQAPTERARRALAELKALGGELPRSKSRVYALLLKQHVLPNSDMTGNSRSRC